MTPNALGGGLARIVGTLTGVASVSISPPGLAMSFRKYNFLGQDLSSTSSRHGSISGNDLHHESFAVISEYDW